MNSLSICKKYNKIEYEERLKTLCVIPNLKGIHEECVVFSKTSSIVNLLSSFKKSIILPQDGNFKENILLDSFCSATIEGAKTTIESIKNSINLNKSKSKDDSMVLNIMKAQLKYFHDGINSEKDLIDAWKIITNGVLENSSKQGNKYRSGMVYVGNESKIIHIPETPDKIQSKMDMLFQFLNSNFEDILKPIISHYYFVYIHPMCDGNGRTARLLQSVLYEQLGYSELKKLPVISIINNDLNGYYSSIRSSNTPVDVSGYGKVIDITPFIEYMLIVLNESLSVRSVD